MRTFPIASNAYHTMITDRSFINNFNSQGRSYVRFNTKIEDEAKDINAHAKQRGRRKFQTRHPFVSRQTRKIWETSTTFHDTSLSFSKPRCHSGLRARIHRNSGGQIPVPLRGLTRSEILEKDRETVKSYLTASRGCRKCNLTVFTAAAKRAGTHLGMFKNCAERPYSWKPIVQSVLELSKDTHAGTDTYGRKNATAVQRRVISQIRDIFRRPTSRKIYFQNTGWVTSGSQLDNLYNLPEVIFHRFQAVVDEKKSVAIEKSRLVWCVPYTFVALENIIFGNMIKSIKEHARCRNESIYPTGCTNYEIGQKSVRTLRDLFSTVTSANNKIYSLDYSRFDASVPMWAKDIFFSIRSETMDMSPTERIIYDFVRIYFKYTPFIYGDKVYIKQKGISSGLLLTNIFDTWWNLTIHFYVDYIIEYFPECIDDILNEDVYFDRMSMDKSKVKIDKNFDMPLLRVLGDDTIILCSEFRLLLHRKVCLKLGMKVDVKHITLEPSDKIFFLGRYWLKNNRPTQTEEYMALRITYTKWYDDKKIPFDLKDLHLFRMLSICLPLVGGKEFLDKYLFDYPPYVEFKKSKRGFTYIKDFIEDTFRYVSPNKMLNVDSF
jgi:hypothetical protein